VLVSTQPQETEKYDVEHLRKAIIDVWLLASAEHTMLSGTSTFGYIAAGLSDAHVHHMATDPFGTELRCARLVDPQGCPHIYGRGVKTWIDFTKLTCWPQVQPLPRHVAPWVNRSAYPLCKD